MTKTQSRLSTQSEFQAALDTAKGLLDLDALSWRISAHGRITARLDEQRLDSHFGKEITEERKHFVQIMRQEIAPLLEAAATESPLYFFFRGPFWPPLSEKDVDELEKRLPVVKMKLLSDSLTARMAIRRTSKGPVLETMRWDISVKKHDLSAGSLGNMPFATLEFVLSTDSLPFGVPRYVEGFLTGNRQVFAF